MIILQRMQDYTLQVAQMGTGSNQDNLDIDGDAFL